MLLVQDRAENSLDAVESGFGGRVKAERQRAGMTQRHLAELLGVDPSAISRLEQGARAIRLGEATRIAEALGRSLSSLVRGDDADLTPRAVLAQRARKADGAIVAIRSAAVALAREFGFISELLQASPEALEAIGDDEAGHPTTANGYFDWVAEKVAEFVASLADSVYVPDVYVAEMINAVVASAVSDLVTTDRESESRNRDWPTMFKSVGLNAKAPTGTGSALERLIPTGPADRDPDA